MSRRSVVVLIVGLLIVGALMAPVEAGFIPPDPAIKYSMADLISKNIAVPVGDKIFSDWSYTAKSGGGIVVLPAAADIDVYFWPSQGNIYSIGLYTVASAGPGSWVDLAFEYKVKTVSGEPLIHDWYLQIIGGAPEKSHGYITGSENIYYPNKQGYLVGKGFAVIDAERDRGFVRGILNNENCPGPYSEVFVMKDILLSGQDDCVSISWIEQGWSQVPEASSFALFGLGFVGLGLFRRFRKR